MRLLVVADGSGILLDLSGSSAWAPDPELAGAYTLTFFMYGVPRCELEGVEISITTEITDASDASATDARVWISDVECCG